MDASRPRSMMQTIWDGQASWQSSPYAPIRSHSPGAGTPRFMPGNNGISKEEMAEMLGPMEANLRSINEKLGGLHSYVQQVENNVNSTWHTMHERTCALDTSLKVIETSDKQVITAAG